jgi:hypothetical protein
MSEKIPPLAYLSVTSRLEFLKMLDLLNLGVDNTY